MPFVAIDDVRTFVRKPHLAPASVENAISMAEGWARGAAPRLYIPPAHTATDGQQDLWSWLVELAAIATDNPTNLSGKAVGSVNQSWNLARRGEILDAIRSRYGGADGTGGAGPRGSFPPPSRWPDPADRISTPRWSW